MSYRRFKFADFQHSPATLANPATVEQETGQSVAELANVAGHTCETETPEPETVAVVADVAGHTSDFSFLDPRPVANVAEVERCISAQEILVSFERATARLIECGRSRGDSEHEALAIIRAELRNDPRLYELQVNGARCLVCGQEEGNGLFLPVLTGRPGCHHWLHSDCWPEHIRRVDERVDVCRRAAGLVK